MKTIQTNDESLWHPYQLPMEKFPKNYEKSLPGSVGSVCLQVHSMRLTSSTQQVLLLQHRRQVLGARQPDGAGVSPQKMVGNPQKNGEVMEKSMQISWDFMGFCGRVQMGKAYWDLFHLQGSIKNHPCLMGVSWNLALFRKILHWYKTLQQDKVVIQDTCGICVKQLYSCI